MIPLTYRVKYPRARKSEKSEKSKSDYIEDPGKYTLTTIDAIRRTEGMSVATRCGSQGGSVNPACLWPRYRHDRGG